MLVTLQLLGGARVTVDLQAPVTVAALQAAAAGAFGTPVLPYKLICNGAAAPAEAGAVIQLREGDVILVSHQRQAPSAKVVAAAAGMHSDEAGSEEKATLPANAAAWERAVVMLLQQQARLPDWVMEWVVLIRPYRIALLIAFIPACVLASHLGVGPIFILCTMFALILTNLGTRKEGEASAYSIFNADVQRLPGTLDADVVDQQIRAGQM